MVNEQPEIIVTKEKFLVFWQLRVSDFEATERFLLYGKLTKNCDLVRRDKVVEKLEV